MSYTPIAIKYSVMIHIMSQHRGNTVLFGIWYSTNSGHQALFQIGLISVPDFCLAAFEIKIEKMRSKTWAYITNFV